MLELPYGRGFLRAEAPARWRVRRLPKPAIAGGQSETAVVIDALDNPVGAPRLCEFVRPGERTAIIVPDKTRISRTELCLPLILDRLRDAGISDLDITIVFARGTHSPQSADVRKRLIGEDAFSRFRTIDHDAREDSDMALVGGTSAGTPVRLNRAVADADKVIAMGAITHHYFAGFGGGPKLLMPGVAALESAVANHRLTLDENGLFNASCRDGVIEGNPVAEDIRDAVRFFPPCVYLGVVLDPAGLIARAFYGGILSAHDSGCQAADAMYRAPIHEAADLTVVSAGGAPRDSTFIQAHKALHRAGYATKEGGSIILAAACDEGFGNGAFPDWFRHAGRNSLKQALRDGYTMNAHTAVAMMDKASRFRILFVSEMPDEDALLMGMKPCRSLDEAFSDAAAELPGGADALVIENGSIYVPTMIEKEN